LVQYAALGCGGGLDGENLSRNRDDGKVFPKTGGMSAATGSMWSLPCHRRPRRPGKGSSGPANDHVFEASIPFDEALRLCVREDGPEKHHALVEPVVVMMFASYEAALGATRSCWSKVAP
jgi:hypothetical protein